MDGQLFSCRVSGFQFCSCGTRSSGEMSGGASSSSNTGVKRLSADCSHSDSETKRFHGDQSTSGVVMLMNDSDVDQSVSQWRVGRQRVFLVDVNDWDSASRYHLRALGSLMGHL